MWNDRTSGSTVQIVLLLVPVCDMVWKFLLERVMWPLFLEAHILPFSAASLASLATLAKLLLDPKCDGGRKKNVMVFC